MKLADDLDPTSDYRRGCRHLTSRRSQAQRRKKQTFNPESFREQAAQRSTSNIQFRKEIRVIRAIRGYKIDKQPDNCFRFARQ